MSPPGVRAGELLSRFQRKRYPPFEAADVEIKWFAMASDLGLSRALPKRPANVLLSGATSCGTST
jgi:hypothetical protein